MGICGYMAERHSSHQSGNTGSELVTSPFGARKAVIPLLPFEQDLIRQLGCSEEEYRFFSDEVRSRGGVRPAAYDHIPDIRCDPVTTTILINLAIGIALTAVSMLLAPKPRQLDDDGVIQRNRGGITGPSRFNTTYGFDSISDLAQYGSPIPIPFGFFVIRDGIMSGGILCTPKLVWSRMFSYGTSQAFKCLYVVGETDMGVPDLNGVWMGNNPLDSLYKQQFALYWNRHPGSGRIKGNNLIAGTRGSTDSADPWPGEDVFVAPTLDGGQYDEAGFSMAYTPSNQSTFGVFNPIANGTDKRLNYKVISIPSESGGKAENVLREERNKWTGENGKSTNSSKTPTQEGLGCGYPRRLGLIRLNGESVDEREIKTAVIGDIATFAISATSIAHDYFSRDVTSEDISNDSIQERIRADDLLQIGENFLIGKSVWRVIDRTPGLWTEGRHIDVSLKCIEVMGDGRIGLTPKKWLGKNRLNEGVDFSPSNHAQINFYPLLSTQMAVVRNLRPTDVTEIGLKSEVWGRMNGLTNFKEVPTPDELEMLDDDQVQLSVGGMNLYFTRYSFFTIHVRPSGNNAQGGDYGWEGIQEEFCIRGASPVAQYNFLRLQPSVTGQWEYRFVPLSCAYITRKPVDAKAWLLDAKRGEYMQSNHVTPYGTFTVMGVGEYVTMHGVEQSDLMMSKGRKPTDAKVITEERPNALTLSAYSTNNNGRAHGYRYALPFGNPEDYGNGYVKTIARTFTDTTGLKTVRVFMTSTVVKHGDRNNWQQDAIWTPPTLEVNQLHSDTSDNWNNGDQAQMTVDILGNNPYARTLGTGPLTAFYRVNVSTVVIRYPAEPGELMREFEHDTQIAEVSHYGDLITRSCDSGPEHSIAYVNESVQADNDDTPQYYDCTTMGLAIRANREFTAMDQPRLWLKRGIKVEKLIDAPNYEPVGEGALYESSNNFAELVYSILTDDRWGLGEYIQPELVDRDAFIVAARFLEQNRLSFDGVIEDRQNVRQYITGLAPMFLCNFIVKNGKFALTPAVPVDNQGNYSNVAVPISAMFSEGNIIQDTFELAFLELTERENFQAVMQYRRSGPLELPETKSIVVRWSGQGNEGISENFDMSAYCTRRGHAGTAARYLLSVRKRIDHTISFQTSPEGLSLGPGDYIKVVTESNPYRPSQNGVILAEDLTVVSALGLMDGTYPITYYLPGATEITEGSLTVVAGKATNNALAGVVFTVRSDSVESHVYLVEQLTINEDMLVDISASYFPTDDQGRSLIAQDLINTDQFVSLP